MAEPFLLLPSASDMNRGKKEKKCKLKKLISIGKCYKLNNRRKLRGKACPQYITSYSHENSKKEGVNLLQSIAAYTTRN